jgi:hypothetical protein
VGSSPSRVKSKIIKLVFVASLLSTLASSVVDCGFKPQSGQTKDYKIGICCFSAKHAALRSKSKDWLVMSTWGLLFQWVNITTIQLSVLIYYKADIIINSLKLNLFSPWYIWKIAHLALKQHSLTLCLQCNFHRKIVKNFTLYIPVYISSSGDL